jgi:hypothetical protein
MYFMPAMAIFIRLSSTTVIIREKRKRLFNFLFAFWTYAWRLEDPSQANMGWGEKSSAA